MSLIKHEDLYTSSGQRRSRALFKETCLSTHKPVAALGKQSGDLIPMRKLFLAMVPEDPTEFIFAETVFGDYAHWKLIADTTWMQDYLPEWRMICDVQRKSDAFRSVIQEAKDGRSAFTAAKYLIEEPWKDKRKKEVNKQNKDSTQKAFETVSDDVKRLSEFL